MVSWPVTITQEVNERARADGVHLPGSAQLVPSADWFGGRKGEEGGP